MQIPQSLIDESAAGRLVPFVGSGVSRDAARFPTWNGLLELMAQQLQDEGNVEEAHAVRYQFWKHRVYDAAEEALRELGKSAFYTVLRKTFDVQRSPTADLSLPEAIWELRPSIVVTTNYDDVLHWANERAAIVLNHQKAELAELYRASPDQPRIWHLHGHISHADSLILAPTQYNAFYGESPQTKEDYEASMVQLRNLVANHTLLFVGFSLDDRYVMDLLESVLEAFGRNLRSSYALLKRGEASSDELWRRYNVRTVEFDDFGSPLVQLVRQIADAAARKRASPPPPAVVATAGEPAPKPQRDPGRVVPKGLNSYTADDQDFFLELLPPPWDRGLPRCVRFWKDLIEQPDPDQTFRIGLLSGPSGSGKSSLVRAGLIPHLSDSVLAIYVEATPDDTELRLVRAVRKHFPELVAKDSPDAILHAVAARPAVPSQRKVLLVLDQFEQWLNTHRADSDPEMARALRACDGVNLQCLLMIRSEFVLAAVRMTEGIGVTWRMDRNWAFVDLFKKEHSRKVLTEFCRAYCKLPGGATQLSDENEKFLDQAIAGLADSDGRIVAVQLSLLAEMVGDRPWTPETLTEFGGVSGLGFAFLRQNFSRPDAPYERHEKGALAILEALLPPPGTTIRGKLRPEGGLRAAAGGAEPNFANLLTVLSQELRLITPTELKDADGTTAEEKYYQLTHDYLVASVRDWLAWKLERHWRGRAKKELEKRTDQWTQANESRYLPGPVKLLSILCGVPWRERKPDQHAMLRAATRHYCTLVAMVAVVISIVGYVLWEVNGRNQGQWLAQTITAATPAELPRLIRDELPGYERWARFDLQQIANDEDADPARRLRARLALANTDGSHVQWLNERLLDCRVDEFSVVRDVLKPYADEEMVGPLWKVIRDETRPTRHRLHAGMALAEYAGNADRWTSADYEFLTHELLVSNPDEQRTLRDYLRPVGDRLLEHLQGESLFASDRETVRLAAALTLADFGREDSSLLARLASDAAVEQYEPLCACLLDSKADHALIRSTLVGLLEQELSPDASELERIRLGRRRAGAAVTLIRLGYWQLALSVFSVGDDPESLTQFVHGCRGRGVLPSDLLSCLEADEEPVARYGLLLALGEYAFDEIPMPRRVPLVKTLTRWSRGESNSAVRAAAEWLLREWQPPAVLNEADVRPRADKNHHDWFEVSVEVTQKSETELLRFVVFRSGSSAMGSPIGEAGRGDDEQPHDVKIPLAFAISDREVSRAQYELFAEPDAAISKLTPTDRHPIIAVNWYEAVGFCRWLTQKAGLHEADQCYADPEGQPLRDDGYPQNWRFDPARPGFRLPTEAEWEVACRAGTTTAFSFGSDRQLLNRYAWHLDTTRKQPVSVAQLRPNLRGLFDIHGNALEWCHDWHAPYEVANDYCGPEFGKSRALRGGGWFNTPDDCRCARREYNTPDVHNPGLGFRLCVSVTQDSPWGNHNQASRPE